jgi:phosphoribosyl 1,2-cyclic phosphodiesterase
LTALKPLEIHFLGTGGGRFKMITQRRRKAGIRLIHGDTQVHIDPGPGALIFSNWTHLNPQNLDGVVVTHCHPDHYTDAEVLIEAMSQGTRNRYGIIAAPRSVLLGNDDCDPSISKYHQKLVGSVNILHYGDKFNLGDLKFHAVKAWHSDPDTIGIRFEAPGLGWVGYTSDTGYDPDLIESYRGVRVLIACTMWPRGQQLNIHLNTDGALRLIEGIKPGCVVLTHLGMRMLNAKPEGEAAYIEESTGIPTVAARDGMRVILSDIIEVQGPRKSDAPRLIDA